MKRLLAGVIALLLAAPAFGQIWAWQDDAGVRRFTNHKELIPENYRDQARVLVENVPEVEAQPESEAVRPARHKQERPAAVEPGPPRQAQVVYDRPPPSEDYLRGVAVGIDIARERQNLAQLIDVAPVVISQPFIPPPSYYPQPLYSAPISTGFDRGRSRHRTLRMALQDQFQAERYPLPPWAVGYVNGVPYPGWTRYDPRPNDSRHGKRLYLR